MNLEQTYNSLLLKLQSVMAKAHGRSLTDAERTELDKGNAELERLKGLIAEQDTPEAKANAERLAAIGGYIDPDAKGRHFHGLAKTGQVARDLRTNQKSVMENGGSVTVPVLDSTPVTMNKPATSLLDVIPSRKTDREYSYLRQVARTNNAAFVAEGDTKPTSTFQLRRIDSHLRVLAHLSEPVDKYVLEDFGNMEQFLGDELFYGLRVSLEAAILNGDGVGENITGFTGVSGIQTQTFDTDPILTARAGLTKVEVVAGDDATSYYVMHPVDWAKIETARLDSGAYLATAAGGTAPIDRMARRLWGSPVVLTVSATPGVGWLARTDAAEITHDGHIDLEWDRSLGFETNEVRARAEGRFDLGVKKPSGIVRLALAAA